MTAAAGAAVQRVGRFELQRVLGRGAQATVWLAHDPRLQRDVAIKLFAGDAAADEVHEWLHEARAVSSLTHPHIVPVFEADDGDGRPFLVFEYVEGGTLAESMRRTGALPPRAAVDLMLGVLDALAAAHQRGIVHRDLKPSNVLLGADGRARVMDFGIAARVSGEADGAIVGTPGYISPEAARGEPPAASMDVFSAGVMLAELLAGKPMLREREPMRALQRVQREDLRLGAEVAVDDTLRGLVQRAMARDAAMRFDGAASMRDALTQWLQASTNTEVSLEGAGGTLEFLLRRMRHKSDFPALGEAVVRIQRTATSETESLASLSSEILKDVALTNKLLRLVNSANFRHTGGGSISTVSRAVSLIGFAGVRNLALSLVLLEHMQNKQHAAQLKEEFLRALMAGTLAGALAPLARESEEVFIGAMFQGLGRLLTEFYFPEEAQQIRQACADGDAAAREKAAQNLLGIGLEELGIGVARSWGLPEVLQRVMRQPAGEVPPRGVDQGVERMRWIGRCANEMTEAMMLPPGSEATARLQALTTRHARALGLKPAELIEASEAARVRLADLARCMKLDVARGTPARRLLPGGGAADPADADVDADVSELPMPTPADTIGMAGSRATSDVLTAGIADVTQTLASDSFKLNDVLRMVLETMFRALGARRLVFCLRDPRSGALTGRLGLGADAERLSPQFHVPMRQAKGEVPDLFAAICHKGADTLISDTTQGSLAARLPAWFRERFDAPCFLLLPVALRGAPFALIYADAASPGAIAVDERELALLRALRNQVVMAFRQSDRGH